MRLAGKSKPAMTGELYVTDRDDWRAWLTENHATRREVWLIYYKKRTGKPSMLYEESVEEALCFGWVDSVVRKVDDEKFARKFSPRTDKSRWSESNMERVERMIREGKMTETGMARIREAKESGEWFRTSASASYRKELIIPPYFEEALAANERARENFDKLGKSYRRNFVRWVDSAKREETRKRRLAEALGLSEHDQKLGLK